MEEEEAAVAGGASPESASGSRRICSGRCRRPIPVCICAALPPEPIPTATHLLLLRHPHELRHRLSTAPALPLCLRRCETVAGRRLRPGSSPALDTLAAAPPSPFPRALFLFPSIPPHLPAARLADFAESAQGKAARGKGLVLVVFDGTWSHAKEMVRASRGFLGGFAAQVSLGFDPSADGGSIFDDELVLRKEPFRGCVSTVEAVARALRLLEPDGAEVEDRLLGVLRTMVRLQAGYLKPMKPRPRLEKKGKEREREEEEEEGNVDTSES